MENYGADRYGAVQPLLELRRDDVWKSWLSLQDVSGLTNAGTGPPLSGLEWNMVTGGEREACYSLTLHRCLTQIMTQPKRKTVAVRGCLGWKRSEQMEKSLIQEL